MENTKKLLRAVLVISLSSFFFAACSHPASAQIDYDALKRGVVKIIAHRPENIKEPGAGIVVGVEGNIAFILTALHVVTYEEEKQRKKAQKIEVVFFDKQYWDPKATARLFERYYKDLDMAVITVDPGKGRDLPSDLPKFTLGDVSELEKGDRVSTIGHPLDLEWEVSINTDTIQGFDHGGDSRKFRSTKTAIELGHSGGPVLDEQGFLIGMVIEKHPLQAIAVKIDAALPVLESWGIPTTNLVRLFGAIVVDSRPSGGEVFLDGQRKGSTIWGPVSIDKLKAGSYSLRVTKEDYAPWEESVDVESGKELSIVAQLEPLPPPDTTQQGLDLYSEFLAAWQSNDAMGLGWMSDPPFSYFGEMLENQEQIIIAFQLEFLEKVMNFTVEGVRIKTIAELVVYDLEERDLRLASVIRALGLSDEDTAVEVDWSLPIPPYRGTVILLTRTIEGELKLAGMFGRAR